MYEMIILALLARWPLHGYLIAKITNDILGPYARLSSGRLYPLLAKLEAAGLIVVADDAASTSDGRRQRRYAITDAGRQRVHELLMDTTSNRLRLAIRPLGPPRAWWKALAPVLSSPPMATS